MTTVIVLAIIGLTLLALIVVGVFGLLLVAGSKAADDIQRRRISELDDRFPGAKEEGR